MEGGEKKQTQLATGKKPTFNQTLEFVVTPAPGASSSVCQLVLCVWDRYLFKECLARPFLLSLLLLFIAIDVRLGLLACCMACKAISAPFAKNG